MQRFRFLQALAQSCLRHRRLRNRAEAGDGSPNHLGAVGSKAGWGFERRMSLADPCGPTIRNGTRPAHCSAGSLFGCLHHA